MDGAFFLNTAIRPMLAWMTGTNPVGVFDGPKPETLLLAIAFQESGIADRIQGPGDRGPARSFYQFERIGVLDVVQRQSVMMKAACEFLVLPDTTDAIWHHMAYNDQLATAVARLALRSDRAALPDTTDEDAAWAYYVRVWKPGKPHRDRWTKNWANAVGIVTR